MKAAVIGFGAVGRRVARLLAADPTFESVVVVDRSPARVAPLIGDWGEHVEVRASAPGELPEASVTVIAGPQGERRTVAAAIANGSHVVCLTDEPSEIRALLNADQAAKDRGVSVAVGVAMAPGLSCVLAAYLRGRLDRVDEVHVASLGTGGPACARRHHSALTSVAVDWEDGQWRRRPGGSGRELVWFPEPVGGADCYRASLADPILLVPAFPGCRRVTSRVAATRRDRLTSWLPMLRPPHPEGLVGAVRVEARGWLDERPETLILGVAVPPATAAAAVAAQTARWAASGRLVGAGAGGLAELVAEPGSFLKELAAHDVRVAAFQGGAGLDAAIGAGG